MSSRSKSNRGRFFGRRKARVIDAQAEVDEPRALDPARSLHDWLEWLLIVQEDKQQRIKLNR
ncbi:MAG TPA: hypothetical protein VIT23_18085 [Terrimicrobiaceae bacterium]|jgi:hypothetical protein